MRDLQRYPSKHNLINNLQAKMPLLCREVNQQMKIIINLKDI